MTSDQFNALSTHSPPENDANVYQTTSPRDLQGHLKVVVITEITRHDSTCHITYYAAVCALVDLLVEFIAATMIAKLQFCDHSKSVCSFIHNGAYLP